MSLRQKPLATAYNLCQKRWLQHFSNTETTDETVLESHSLANRLGNLPLALSQVAALIKRKDMKFSEFLEALNKEVSQKELLLDESEYGHILWTIWRIEKLLPSTKSLLNVLSLLDRGEIQVSLFGSRLPTNLSNAFPTSKLKYYDARDSLLRGSLIQRNRNTGQILIHPLLQTATRAKMSPQELQNSFSIAVNMLVENWPEASFAFSHETETWQKAEKFVPHVIKMADEYDKNPNWDISLDAHRDLAALLQKMGWSVGISNPTARLTYAGTLLRKATSLRLSECGISLLIYANVMLQRCRLNMQMPYFVPDRI